jgi:hypothetical protein
MMLRWWKEWVGGELGWWDGESERGPGGAGGDEDGGKRRIVISLPSITSPLFHVSIHPRLRVPA